MMKLMRRLDKLRLGIILMEIVNRVCDTVGLIKPNWTGYIGKFAVEVREIENKIYVLENVDCESVN
jgi:hypothetical protein